MPQFQHLAQTIAIIDDQEPVRIAISSLLRSFGYTTLEFDSAEALLASQVPGHFDCIVTDVQMPGMNGLELQDELRRTGSAIPMILITAFPEDALRKRALQAGAACFLAKPVNASQLLQCLATALGNNSRPS